MYFDNLSLLDVHEVGDEDPKLHVTQHPKKTVGSPGSTSSTSDQKIRTDLRATALLVCANPTFAETVPTGSLGPIPAAVVRLHPLLRATGIGP